MGFIKVYRHDGEKEVVTLALDNRFWPRLSRKRLLIVLAISLALDIAFTAAFLHFIFGKI